MLSLRKVLRPAYECFLNTRYLGRGIPWSINGAPFRIDARFRAQMGRTYDPEIAAFLRSRITTGMRCWDVGANVGVYVLQFAAWGARVTAFEPNPRTAAALRRHIEMNKFSRSVEVVAEAIGAEPGTAILYAESCDGMSRLGAPNKLLPRTQPLTVPLTTLDEYVARSHSRPDLVLIDIEGFEIQALSGAKKLIDSKEDLLILVEMHPNVWESAETDRRTAERVLSDLRLIPEPISGQTDPLGEYGTVLLRRH
jgi:FkbM family methyltransferase